MGLLHSFSFMKFFLLLLYSLFGLQLCGTHFSQDYNPVLSKKKKKDPYFHVLASLGFCSYSD